MDPEDTQEVVTDPPPGGEPEPTTGEEGQAPEGEQVTPEVEAPAGDDAGAVQAKAETLAKRMAQKRIRQLTSKVREAERKATEAQERIEGLEKRIGPEPDPVVPNSADFETLDEFLVARDEWRDAMKARQTTEQPPAPSPEKVARAESADRIEAGLEALGEQYPDAVDVVMNDDWSCSTAMYDFIESSESGPALAYHLATNEELADKIARLSPVLAARELVKVEAGLPATKPSATPPPPPGNPVSPSASSVVTDPDKLSPKQWKEWRLGELAKRA
jgi:hypothetical protein